MASTTRASFGLVQALGALILGSVLVSIVVFRNGQIYLKSFDHARDMYASFDLPLLTDAAAKITSSVVTAESSVGSVQVSTAQESAYSPPVIGYAISITQCERNDERLDQAAILLYSVHRNSIRNPSSGSKYDYRAYAFVHPEAINCTETLEVIGYEVKVYDSPVLKSEIKGTLKEYVHEASCCQEKEFLKLYSYTLTEHKVVAHLDLDCLVLQPLDDLFDSMIEGPRSPARKKLPLQWVKNTTDQPTDIEAFFTRDYNLVNPGTRQPHQIGIQGGFIVVKPSLEVFELYKATIIEGNYSRGPGWGGQLRYGGYYGAAQIQGLCAYFFGHIRPGKSAELNRCYYNFMADAPRDTNKDNPRCRTLEEDCPDCRDVAFEEIKTIHFTLCTKPWWCLADEVTNGRSERLGGEKGFKLCLAAHEEWFKTRLLLEQTWAERDENYSITPEIFKAKRKGGLNYTNMSTKGFCHASDFGGPKYLKMKFPNQHVEL
jgi:hypothetical protein